MEDRWEEPYNIAIQIENRRCRVVETLKSRGIFRFEVADIRGSGKGPTRHLVKFPSGKTDEMQNAHIALVEASRKSKGEKSQWFESEGCNICNTMLSHGSFLISGKSLKNSAFVYTFVTPSFNAYRSIVSELESSNVKITILKVEKYEKKVGMLTEKQERVLWLASRMGLFDYPRKISIIELSHKLGIGPSTLSELVRRGIRRILHSHFEA